MAKKVSEQAPFIGEIKKQLTAGNIVLGTEVTTKLLRKNGIEKVYFASNVNKVTKDEISKYAGLVGVEVEDVSMNNEELGILCKKPFFVSVLSVKKQ